jgi:tRNA threonylcarbamoyladenosine biosynthesis protein TsaE
MSVRTLATLDDTKAFAQEVAASLRGGDVVGLVGDLGSGKTTFTQELAAALGVQGAVRSPTFVLMNLHAAAHGAITRLCHVDAYRLKSEDELRGIGFDEYAGDPSTVTVVEWADLVPFLRAMPGYRELRFTLTGDTRVVAE